MQVLHLVTSFHILLTFVFQADNCSPSVFVSLDIQLFITDPRNLFGAGSSFDFPQVVACAALFCSQLCSGRWAA